MQRICIHHYGCSVDAPSFLYFLSFPGFGWCGVCLFVSSLMLLFFFCTFFSPSLLCICVDSVFWGINFCTSSIWRIFFDAINFEHFFFSSLLHLYFVCCLRLTTITARKLAQIHLSLTHFDQTAIFTFSSLISTTQHSTTTSSHNNFNTPIKLHNIDFTTLPPAAATTALSQLKSRQLDCHCARINQQNAEHQHRSTATLCRRSRNNNPRTFLSENPEKMVTKPRHNQVSRQSIAQLRFHHHDPP